MVPSVVKNITLSSGGSPFIAFISASLFYTFSLMPEPIRSLPPLSHLAASLRTAAALPSVKLNPPSTWRQGMESGLSKERRQTGFLLDLIYFEWRSMHAKSLQSCPAVCDPVDDNLPGSSDHGILQARILEWVAISSSRGSFQPRDQIRVPVRLLYWQEGSLALVPPRKPRMEKGVLIT